LDSVELIFYKLVSNEIGLADFEKWVYSETALEDILSFEDYLELISINYKKPSGLYEAEKTLSKYFSLGKYHEWNVRNILKKIIERPDDVHKYIEQCYDLYCDGFNFLDNIGLGYGVDIKCPEYSDATVDDYYPQILVEAEKVIDWLDNGKIVITGHSGNFQGIEYDDNRNTKETEPSGYKVKKV